MRLAVHVIGTILQRCVDFGDLATDRREQLRHRLDGFNRAEHLAGGHGRSDVRQLHVNDIAELLLREIGNADDARIAINANPLVLFGVLQVSWVAHRSPGTWVLVTSWASCRTALAQRRPSPYGREYRFRVQCPAPLTLAAHTPSRWLSSGTASACRWSPRLRVHRCGTPHGHAAQSRDRSSPTRR